MYLRKIAWVGEECVACGNCEKHCPFGAIAIHKGLYAKVNAEKCKGCSKCVAACPASVIVCEKREATLV